MSLFLSRALKIVMLVGLVAYVVQKGVVPALSGVDADFAGYFTAAKIVADGQDARRLYDDYWFREQIRRYQMETPDNPGKFAPFPPPTALLLVPLAGCQPLTALRIVTAVSLACLIGSIFLLAAILAWRPIDAALFVLASGAAILTTLRFGQPYILVSSSCILGYYLYLNRRPWLAGVCLGLFVPIKYFPVVILGCFALLKQWRVVLGGVAAIAAIAAVSIAVLGWEIHQTFLLSVLGNHLAGRLTLRPHTAPFTAVYQSIDALFYQLFVFDSQFNPRPLWTAPHVAMVGIIVAKCLLLVVAALSLAKLLRQRAADALAPGIGVLGILVLVIAPATAGYMCVLLWLPVGLLVNYFLTRGARLPAYLLAGAYVVIGLFIPYGHAYRFEGRGGLTVLAYPRLFLLLAMFFGSAWLILRPPRSNRPAVAMAA